MSTLSTGRLTSSTFPWMMVTLSENLVGVRSSVRLVVGEVQYSVGSLERNIVRLAGGGWSFQYHFRYHRQ